MTSCQPLAPVKLTLAAHASFWYPGPRWPSQLLAADDVKVQVVDGLAAGWAIIDDYTIALCESLESSDVLCSPHQVTQGHDVALLCRSKAVEPVFDLRNDD